MLWAGLECPLARAEFLLVMPRADPSPEEREEWLLVLFGHRRWSPGPLVVPFNLIVCSILVDPRSLLRRDRWRGIVPGEPSAKLLALKLPAKEARGLAPFARISLQSWERIPSAYPSVEEERWGSAWPSASFSRCCWHL